MTITATLPHRQTPTTIAAPAARATAIATAALMLALMPSTLLALLIDARTFNGAPLWLKPLHFELALALNFATLALLLPLLIPAWRQSRTVRWSMLAGGFSAVLEIVWIAGEAALGRGSHFNVATQLETALYPLAGAGSLLIVLSSGILGYGLWRSPALPGSAHMHRGATLGLLLGSIVTLIVAGYMSAGHGHLVGGPQTDAFGLPFLGWATRGGDLRVPHFFATHAMQALPIAGLVADRLGWLRASWLMPAAAGLYFAGVLAVFAEAVMGLPFIAG